LVRAFGTPIAGVPGLGYLFPEARELTSANFSSVGLPEARARCIRSLARAVSEEEISFPGVVNVEEFLTRFRALPGIGEWTAQYVAMRALGEPDAFPASDLGLLRALGLRSSRQLEIQAEAWRPWRAYAAMYLWQTVPKKGVTQHADTFHKNQKFRRAAAAGR
jgi:AraC family transcriptional regulator of adaptative response / DNA-3-methyladenine glycosylase II